MIFYVLSVFYAHFLVLIGHRLSRGVLFLLLQPIVIFSALRGASGKDSPLYLHRFYSLEENWGVDSFFDEPILNSIIYFSKHVLGGSHVLFFVFHAELVVFLFAIIVSYYARSRVYLLTIGPMFLIDGLVNGMRITIAYHAFAVFFLLKSKVLGPLLVFCSHVSGLLMYFFSYIFRYSKGRLWYQALFFAFGLFAFWLFLNNRMLFFDVSPRVLGKLERYSDMTLSTSYSGIVDVFLIISIGALFYYQRCQSLLRFFLICCFLLLFGSLMIYLNQHSLAFLRVWKLFLVALCFSVYTYGNNNRIAFIPLFFLGIFYSFNFLRQVLTDPGFLPYPGPVLGY